MKERPIIFNADMVRAVLDGRKTQTRRIVNGMPSSHDFHGWVLSSTSTKDEGKACWAIGKSPLLNKPIRVRCPFGEVGDRLWVRETFATLGNEDGCAIDWSDNLIKEGGPDAARIYRASCEQKHGNYGLWSIPGDAPWKPHTENMQYEGTWVPSIHMPRWASRITLEITGVRVERLNSMTEQDAIAEGCSGGHGSIPGYMYSATPHEHFHHLWESIYGADSWQANPWVWVIEFKRVEVE